MLYIICLKLLNLELSFVRLSLRHTLCLWIDWGTVSRWVCGAKKTALGAGLLPRASRYQESKLMSSGLIADNPTTTQAISPTQIMRSFWTLLVWHISKPNFFPVFLWWLNLEDKVFYLWVLYAQPVRFLNADFNLISWYQCVHLSIFII